LKCLLASSALDKEHSKVHEQTIRFKLALDKDPDALAPKSGEVIKLEFNLVPSSMDLSTFNDKYLKKHKDCARRSISALATRKLLNPGSSSTCEKDIVAVINLPSISIQEATEALELLTSWKSSEVEALRSRAATKWPKATIFAAKS
jgi:hypothetical protein